MKFKNHGNGFLRFYLAADTYLHIYDDSIPRQKVCTDIHDHRFRFLSKIIYGELLHVRYEAAQAPFNPLWDIYRSGEDDKLYKTNETTSLLVKSEILYRAGESYVMEPGDVHRVIPSETTVTLVRVGTRYNMPVRTFVPCGIEPDNEFDNTAKEAL